MTSGGWGISWSNEDELVESIGRISFTHGPGFWGDGIAGEVEGQEQCQRRGRVAEKVIFHGRVAGIDYLGNGEEDVYGKPMK